MASKKLQPVKKQGNQTGSQSGDYRAQQLHNEAGGIRNEQSRDKSTHRKQDKKLGRL
jgi:hypothetical protein